MKKTRFTRILSLVLAAVSLFGILTITAPLHADAASVSSSISSVKVSSSGMYITTQKTALKTKASTLSSTYATLQKGTLISTSGTSDKYFKVKVDGTTYYVKKSDVKEASDTTKATLYYTTIQNAALRTAPYETASKTNLSKGTVLYVVGQVQNKHGNSWLVVSYNGKLQYMYSGNAKKTDKITVKITGSDTTLDTLKSMDLKASVSPSSIGFTWESSNSNVAYVNIAGKVTGVSAGKATIYAKVGNLVKAAWDVTVTKNVSLNVKAVRQTTDYTCSAAAALAVLRYYGKHTGTSDKTLYNSTKANVGETTKTLNKSLNNIYKYATFKSYSSYENAIYNSLKQGSPVIARVKFPKGFFTYASDGHYTTIIEMYQKNGETWVKLVDSYVDRFKSNSYTDRNTGEVNVPLKTLFQYGTYGGKSSVWLIYNP